MSSNERRYNRRGVKRGVKRRTSRQTNVVERRDERTANVIVTIVGYNSVNMVYDIIPKEQKRVNFTN